MHPWADWAGNKRENTNQHQHLEMPVSGTSE